MKYLRVKKKKDFQKILRTGKRAFGGSLTLVYVRAERTAMAVCVGKKYGKSVKRNRIKRLLREAFRTSAERLSAPVGVLLIPKVAENYSYDVFRRDIAGILRREGLSQN